MLLYFTNQNDLDSYLLILSRIEKTLSLLIDFPEMAPFNDFLNTPEIFVPKTSYKIVFEIKDENLYILRIFHTSRKYSL